MKDFSEQLTNQNEVMDVDFDCVKTLHKNQPIDCFKINSTNKKESTIRASTDQR